MRYAIENPDGIDLLSGSTPLPEGAIAPISNWDEILHVPYRYRKVVDGQVVEMTQEEKDAYDVANPVSLEECQVAARAYLEDTDWYVTRSVDPSSGVPVPQDILDSRIIAREIL